MRNSNKQRRPVKSIFLFFRLWNSSMNALVTVWNMAIYSRPTLRKHEKAEHDEKLHTIMGWPRLFPDATVFGPKMS